ncbi:uncharacterized protein LOC142656088 [Rhinoderma darwinii]|uniref:uncharacterized protein LOC142656088 n=1 Tax=Rhinoderma darwinii TaxID=43563 RepID=UPI003F66B1CA
MEDLSNLKQKIQNYQLEGQKLGDLGYTRILLQVCGSAGHGKSSLINSFMYALHDGQFSISAPVAQAEVSYGGLTTKRLPYELTKVITLVDNRGFGKSDNFEKEEVYTQLANLQDLNVDVEWIWCYEKRMEAVTNAANNTNDLLVPLYVHSIEEKIPENEKTEMKEFFKTTQKLTGFLPIIVLTKRLSGDAKNMRLQFEDMGMENIFEVENYTMKDDVKTPGKDKTFLSILSKLLDQVDFLANNRASTLDTPENEHKKRMQMLLKIAHDNDIQREKKKWMEENPQPKKPEKSNCRLL